MKNLDNPKEEHTFLLVPTIREGEQATVNDIILAVLDNFPFYVMLIDSEHHIQLANEAVRSNLGLDPQEIVGKYCPQVVHGLNHPFPGCPLEEAVREGHFVEKELFDERIACWLNSKVYPTQFRTQEGKAVFLHTMHDITKIKQTQDENVRNYQIQSILNDLLQSSLSATPLEEQLNRCIDQITSIPWLSLESKGAIFLVEEDPGVLVMKAQRGLEKLMPTCARIPFGRCLCGRAANSGKIEYADHIDERHEIRYEGISPHGHYCVPILSAGKLLGVINLYIKEGYPRDEKIEGVLGAVADILAGIIERKRAGQQLAQYSEHLEEMVKERTRELLEAQERLVRQEKLAVLGQLAGSVGHELRNPLGVISNAAYYLKLIQPDADTKVKEYLNMVEKETITANKIITDLLDFTRIKSVEREPVAVSELVRQTLERFPVPSPVEVVLEIPADLPPVYADPRQMTQVLGNLTVNACQAIPSGGKLTITAHRQEQKVAIAVKDNGVGIPPENMSKLFEPLFTTKFKGIGLGLAVSKKLAEANGGHIEVESEPGQGTTFSVYLPVYQE